MPSPSIHPHTPRPLMPPRHPVATHVEVDPPDTQDVHSDDVDAWGGDVEVGVAFGVGLLDGLLGHGRVSATHATQLRRIVRLLPLRQGDYPAEAVRDLLGLARAMYQAELRGRRDARVLTRLRRAADHIDQATELYVQTKDAPGCVGWRAAWHHAEAAARLVGECVEITDSGEAIVMAAAGRLGACVAAYKRR